MKSCRSIHYLYVDFFMKDPLVYFCLIPFDLWASRKYFPCIIQLQCSKKIYLDRNLSNRLMCKWHGASPKVNGNEVLLGCSALEENPFCNCKEWWRAKAGNTVVRQGYKCNLNNWKSLAIIYNKYCDGVQCDIFHSAMYVLVDKVW